MKKSLAFLCILLISFSGCSIKPEKETVTYQPNTDGVWNIEKSPLNGAPLNEDKSVYSSDTDNEVVEVFLTVKPVKNNQTKENYTFDGLNSYTGEGDEPYCEVIFQEGTDGSGPAFGKFGYGETVVNGRLEVKGDISTLKQRSYQVKLYNRAGLWRGVQTINFYKELGDLSRMKNKLGFDAVEKLSEVIGLRTRFVHLYIKDNSGKTKSANYTDMGLYTYIEQLNKTYLKSRGFDADGNLYKANNFDFSRNADKILSEADAGYSNDKFESVLTIREGKDHTKLIKMLDAVNNLSINADTLIKTYFSEDNILSFAAINILFGNYKSMYDNYYIYSPLNSNSWYLIPGDFGNMLEERLGETKASPPDAFVGLPMLYDNVLLRRYFSVQGNVDKLISKVEEVHKTINGDFVNQQLKIYKQKILPILFSMPDLINLKKAAEYVDPYIEEMPVIVEDNYKRFKANVVGLLPPFITKCSYQSGAALVEWQGSGTDVQYLLEVARDAEFNSIVYTKDALTTTSSVINGLESGLYYVRVTAKTIDGKARQCANIYSDSFGDRIYGVQVLIVG